jgi:hypothetical protein
MQQGDVNQVMVAHACNPSYLGSWDLEDHSLRPTWANSSWYSTSKITRAKWTRGVAQRVERLLCKHGALSSNSNPTKIKQSRTTTTTTTTKTQVDVIWEPGLVLDPWTLLFIYCHFSGFDHCVSELWSDDMMTWAGWDVFGNSLYLLFCKFSVSLKLFQN